MWMGLGAGETGFDFNSYKKFYDIWIRSSSEMLEELMRSPQFAAMAGKASGDTADFKKQIDEMIEASLKSMHLPSSSDIKELSRRMRSLEERFQQLAQKMESTRPQKPIGRKKR